MPSITSVGITLGVTVTAVLAALVPNVFVAVTVSEYDCPVVRPVTVQLRSDAVAVQVFESGLEVTV
nr:hypothetical protein [uncultured Aurantimicrobium sp.]